MLSCYGLIRNPILFRVEPIRNPEGNSFWKLLNVEQIMSIHAKKGREGGRGGWVIALF